MLHKCKIALFLSCLTLFSVYESSAVWWWLSTPKQSQEALPDISTALLNEFDRLCGPDLQTQPLAHAITTLKHSRIPAILQDIEYRHAEKPFRNNAELLNYAFDFVRAACLDFYGEQVDQYCAHSFQNNPPCNPEYMNLNTLRKNCIRYLYGKACQEMSTTKNSTLSSRLKNISADVNYAVHLSLKYSSPVF